MWVKGRDTESRRRITPKPASPRPTSNNVAGSGTGSGTAATSPGPGHLPLLAQVIFYGALLAVIMSTWYGTLLAPSVTISESALKGWLTRRNLSDHKMLALTRWVVACFAVCVTLYALWALGTNTGIHKIVESAYKITLVVAFTPWWRAWTGRAPRPKAYLSIGLGLAAWLPLEYLATESGIPPQFAGLLMSVVGMVLGL